MSTSGNEAFPRDIIAFLSNYPGVPESEVEHDPPANYLFYLGRLRCRPDNMYIDEIHSKWYADYDELEWNHHYIQWLFPIQEDGANVDAYRLKPREIEMMSNNGEIVCRLIKSYEMMLDFYGMRLLSDAGLLGRSLPPRDYESRYRNLLGEWGIYKCFPYVARIWVARATWLAKPHNNLRITRILKCLSELGLEHLNSGFLLHVLNEQSENDMLNSRALRLSMDRWWANCIRDHRERGWMYKTVMRIRQVTGRFPDDVTNWDHRAFRHGQIVFGTG